VTAEEQGRIEMWSRRIELNLMRPVGMVWVHGSPLTRGVVKHQLPEAADQNRALVREFQRFLDRELASREFVAGPEFTIADILALTTLDFGARLVELPMDGALAALAGWHTRVSSRPSAQAHP
jgi:glutathione S-transferase